MPSTPDQEETRAAVRLVALCTFAALGIYLAVAGFVAQDEFFVGYGREKNVHFAEANARTTEREGLAPHVLWAVGSSITRESIDEFTFAEWLARDGHEDWEIRKYAFGYGAPVFTLATLDRLPVQAGDIVYTTVSYDNFEVDWARSDKADPMYWQLLLSPERLWQVDQLPVPDRIEYSLAWSFPVGFHRNREQFRDGIQAWLNHALGVGPKPRRLKRSAEDPFQNHLRTKGLRRTRELAEDKKLQPDDLQTAPGQVNWDALLRLADETEARGATLMVGFVPASPHYHRRYLADGTAEQTLAHLDAALPRFRLYETRPDWHYFDYKHPNRLGRQHTNRELYAWFEDVRRELAGGR